MPFALIKSRAKAAGETDVRVGARSEPPARRAPSYTHTPVIPQVETTCAICLADMEDGEAVRQLIRCHHAYHAPCLDTWLQRSALCPLCKRSVLGSATGPPAIRVAALEMSPLSAGTVEGAVPPRGLPVSVAELAHSPMAPVAPSPQDHGRPWAREVSI